MFFSEWKCSKFNELLFDGKFQGYTKEFWRRKAWTQKIKGLKISSFSFFSTTHNFSQFHIRHRIFSFSFHPSIKFTHSHNDHFRTRTIQMQFNDLSLPFLIFLAPIIVLECRVKQKLFFLMNILFIWSFFNYTKMSKWKWEVLFVTWEIFDNYYRS